MTETSPDRLVSTVGRFFRRTAPTADGALIAVAFSGGPDSTALLATLIELAASRPLRIAAVHVDHGLDPRSTRRARQAEELATRLGVACQVLRPDPGEITRHRDGIEAGARAARYRLLHRWVHQHGAHWLAVAHHRNDQAETVLLRLLLGSGLFGLGAMAPVRERLVRPLLDVSRDEIERALDAHGFGGETNDDPANHDPAFVRNRVRHRLVPHLLAEDPSLAARLPALADTLRRLAGRLDHWLDQRLPIFAEGFGGAVAVERARLVSLPEPLFGYALARLHRRAGLPYPPGLRARQELRRQLRHGGRVGCDCHHGWRWQADAVRIRLVPNRPTPPPFAHTVQLPGTTAIPELGLALHTRRDQGCDHGALLPGPRAALAPRIVDSKVEVRSRMPRDRIRVRGSERLIRDLFTEVRHPGHLRPRTPLLCVDGAVAWVPGVAIADPYRLPEGTDGLIVTLTPLQSAEHGANAPLETSATAHDSARLRNL